MAVPGLDLSDQFIHSVVVFSGHWIALSYGEERVDVLIGMS